MKTALAALYVFQGIAMAVQVLLARVIYQRNQSYLYLQIMSLTYVPFFLVRPWIQAYVQNLPGKPRIIASTIAYMLAVILTAVFMAFEMKTEIILFGMFLVNLFMTIFDCVVDDEMINRRESDSNPFQFTSMKIGEMIVILPTIFMIGKQNISASALSLIMFGLGLSLIVFAISIPNWYTEVVSTQRRAMIGFGAIIKFAARTPLGMLVCILIQPLGKTVVEALGSPKLQDRNIVDHFIILISLVQSSFAIFGYYFSIQATGPRVKVRTNDIKTLSRYLLYRAVAEVGISVSLWFQEGNVSLWLCLLASQILNGATTSATHNLMISVAEHPNEEGISYSFFNGVERLSTTIMFQISYIFPNLLSFAWVLSLLSFTLTRSLGVHYKRVHLHIE